MIFTSQRKETWAFKRVDWPTLSEVGEFTCFTEGNLELSAFSELRASGSLNHVGLDLDKTSLVRIYYGFTDAAGNKEMFVLATMFLCGDSPKYNGEMVTGSVSLESVLRIPLSTGYGRPYVVKKGTNAVAKAISLLEDLKLKTNKATSNYVLSRDVVYDEDENWLTIINDLLSMAGFSSCYPDAYGTIQLEPYVEPSERKAKWEFVDDETSIMLPEVELSNNIQDIPNAVYYTFSNDKESLWAKSSNIDPLSKISIPSRGYETSEHERVSELAATTKEGRLAELKTKAKAKLIDNSSEIEYISLRFPWVPLQPNDSIKARYLTAGLEWSGMLTEMRIDVGVHAFVDAKARKFARPQIKTAEDGGSW